MTGKMQEGDTCGTCGGMWMPRGLMPAFIRPKGLCYCFEKATPKTAAVASAPKTGMCLSIQQPWAWLIVNGFKDIENRDWPTRVRGVIGIHAGKRIDRDAIAWIGRMQPLITLPDEYEVGGLVGIATLTDCVTESQSEWFFGKFGFVMANAEPLPSMLPCRGMLGFFCPATSPVTGK